MMWKVQRLIKHIHVRVKRVLVQCAKRNGLIPQSIAKTSIKIPMI